MKDCIAWLYSDRLQQNTSDNNGSLKCPVTRITNAPPDRCHLVLEKVPIPFVLRQVVHFVRIVFPIVQFIEIEIVEDPLPEAMIGVHDNDRVSQRPGLSHVVINGTEDLVHFRDPSVIAGGRFLPLLVG